MMGCLNRIHNCLFARFLKKHLNPLDHSDPCREAELNLLFSTAVFYMTPELGIVGTGGYVISIPIKSSQ